MKWSSKSCFNFHAILLGLACVSITVADAGEPGFYFDTSLGVATVDRMAIKDDTGNLYNEYHAEFDPGPSLRLGGGYRLRDWFSAGADFGFVLNRLSVAGGDFHQFSPGTYYYAQVPMLANFEFSLPNKSRFVPFIGGGPGMVYRVVHFPRYQDDPVTRRNWVFGWQVYGGLRYKLSEKCSLGAVFNLLDTDSWEYWKRERNNYQSASIGGTQTKSVALSFKMDF